MWERPTREDLETCSGCGKPVWVCDHECDAYYRLERQALEDEANGIFLPSYCAATDTKFCTRCGKTNESESPLCWNCWLWSCLG